MHGVEMTEIRIGEDSDGRITVGFSYNPAYISKIKTIKGYKWHPEEKYWSLPPDNGILNEIVLGEV